MTALTVLAIASGALAGAGLGLLVWTSTTTTGGHAGSRLWRTVGDRLGDRHRGLRLSGVLAVGGLVWAVSGWPVAGLLAAAGAWWLPVLLGPDRHHQAQVARIEAVASWIEQVRDLITSSSGLQQAIATTVPVAPAPIAAAVAHLAERLRLENTPEGAFAEWAEVVDVPTGDLAATALSRATRRHSADLAALLSSLAQIARDQATMLVRIAASRARVRTAMRIIIATTIALAVVLIVFTPTYLDFYDSVAGQLVLALIGGLWAWGLSWIARLARTDLGPRVLRPTRQVLP